MVILPLTVLRVNQRRSLEMFSRTFFPVSIYLGYSRWRAAVYPWISLSYNCLLFFHPIQAFNFHVLWQAVWGYILWQSSALVCSWTSHLPLAGFSWFFPSLALEEIILGSQALCRQSYHAFREKKALGDEKHVEKFPFKIN